MTDPILALAIGATCLACLSVILSRLIPDDYDRRMLRPVIAVRRRERSDHRR